MNLAVFNFLHNWLNISPWLNYLFYFFAVYLGWLLIVVALGQVAFARNKLVALGEVSFAFLCAVIAWFLTSLLKYSLHDPRPFLAITHLKTLFLTGGYDSFPSGHATFFSALALGLFYHNKKLGSFFLFAAFLVGVARVIVGVHWPIDVLGGFLIGVLISSIAYLTLKKYIYKN